MKKGCGVRWKNLAKAQRQIMILTRRLLLSASIEAHKRQANFLRTSRELLMKELRELGYDGRMKYNGEVFVDNIAEEDVVLAKKDHKLIIHLNKKQVGEKEKDPSESNL
jgi:hypothetical protein